MAAKNFLLIYLSLCVIFIGSQTEMGAVAKQEVLPGVFWMHLQKTSSWLGNFLLLWGCPDLRRTHAKEFKEQSLFYSVLARDLPNIKCDVKFYTGNFGFGYHVPMLKEPAHVTVTLFRKPSDRIISMFLYGKGIHQIMFPLGFPNRIKRKFGLRANITASQYPILSYASLPGIAGCQTKMVMGKECAAVVQFSPADLQEAVHRLHHGLAFVGLTEESAASARLFLAMYRPPGNTAAGGGGGMANGAESSADLWTTYSQAPRKNKGHTNEINAQLKRTLLEQNWRDVHDEFIYREAAKLFYARCQRYGVQTQYTLDELIASIDS